MHVTSLYIHPVKSCAGVAVDRLDFDALGPRGDRRWMIVDPEGRFRSQRATPKMATIRPRFDRSRRLVLEADDAPPLLVPPDDTGAPAVVQIWNDTCAATDLGDESARWLSDRIGLASRLVTLGSGFDRRSDAAWDPERTPVAFADGYPILIVSSASLEALNERLDAPVSMSRFRPNIVIDASSPFAEDDWREIRIGSLPIRVVKPCARCTVVDLEPSTGRRSPGVLAALSTFRAGEGKVYFGQNAVHRGSGTIRVGDVITVTPPPTA